MEACLGLSRFNGRVDHAAANRLSERLLRFHRLEQACVAPAAAAVSVGLTFLTTRDADKLGLLLAFAASFHLFLLFKEILFTLSGADSVCDEQVLREECGARRYHELMVQQVTVLLRARLLRVRNVRLRALLASRYWNRRQVCGLVLGNDL